MEPERDIEKDLKAYAQKRRDAAGAPPELHPARRKSLQDEAARLGSSPSAETRSVWQIFLGSWPRLAVAGVALIALAIITWTMLPPQNATLQQSQEMARNEPEAFKALPADKLALTAPAETPAPELKRKKVSPALSPRAREQAKSDSTVADVASVNNRPVAAAPAPVVSFGASSTLTATRAPAASRDSDFSFFDLKKTPAASSADRNALGISPPAQNGVFAEAQTPAVIQSFLRTGSPVKDGADRSGASIASSNVLASFRVEQTLDKLRIIDRDGSVYLGFVAKTPAAGDLPAGALAKAGEQKSAARFYRFRVSGTNRTLKEEVVFTGDFLNAHASGIPQLQGAVGGAAVSGTTSATTDDALPLELHRAVLDGRLLVGGTNNIEIHATPAKP